MATAMDNSVEIYRVHLEALLRIATSGANTGAGPYGGGGGHLAGPSVAQKSGSWTSFSLKELTVSPVYAFVNLPACRAATLEFFASLIREHVALYLSGLENLGATIDYGNVEEALNEVDAAMQQDLRERGGQWCLQMFEWSLETLAEISKKNANRRAFVAATGVSGGLSEILQIYATCRSTRLLLDLLNECVGRLLTSKPERCIAGLLETTARFGSFCDWILTFIGTKYPKTIVDQLLTVGASDFQAFVTDMIAKQALVTPQQIVSKRDQYHRDKLISLSSIIGHLAHQQGAEVRRQLAAIILNGLGPNADQKQQYALVFIIKAASLSRDVADLLMQDLYYLVTADQIATVIRVFALVPREIVFGDQNPAHLLINVIMSLKESTLSLLYDKLLHLSFDELNLEKRDPRTNVFMIQKYALTIMEVLMTNMERYVHNNVSFPPGSTPLLNEIENNLPLALKRLFSMNELQRNYYFKSLTLLCFVRGEAKTIEILASVLFHAANEQQMSLFICFCRILHPVHVQSVEKLFVKLPEYYEKFRQAATAVSMKGFDENEYLWVDNVRTLIQWDQNSIANKETNIVNLTEIFLNNYAIVVEYLLPLVSVKSCSRAVLDILTKVGQPVHQSPKTVLRLTTYCCLLLFDTFAELDTSEGLELHKAFVDYMVMFVQSQTSYAVEIVMRTLLARIMRQPLELLFGLSAATSKPPETADNVADNGKNVVVKGEAVKGEEEQAPATSSAALLLVGNQKLGTLKRNAADETESYAQLDLVHSGVIRRKFPRGSVSNEAPVSEKGILCKLAFVRLIDRLCSSPRAPPVGASASASGASSSYSLDVCRILASLLTEYFCPDAVAADHSWDDWEASRNSIERLLATSKRMDEVSFAWDLLMVVSEAYPCLWFCLPIVKSVLGAAIAQCENAIDKTERVVPKLLKTLERLFLVMYKGRMLSEPLAYAVDLLPHITQYEAACVLGETWRYFQSIAPDSKSLQHHFECVQCHFGDQPVEPVKGDQNRHLETILLVVQANISAAGHLLEKFVDVRLDDDTMNISDG